MIARRSLAWLAMGAIALPLTARASSAPRPTLAGDVVFVRVAGPWAADQREGFSRLVLVRGTARDEQARLYVQWVTVDTRAGRFAVARTEEVEEVFDWRLRIDDYQVNPTESGSSVTLDATVITNGMKRRYDLVIGSPGVLTFRAR